jgi:hypothetical protein
LQRGPFVAAGLASRGVQFIYLDLGQPHVAALPHFLQHGPAHSVAIMTARAWVALTDTPLLILAIAYAVLALPYDVDINDVSTCRNEARTRALVLAC